MEKRIKPTAVKLQQLDDIEQPTTCELHYSKEDKTYDADIYEFEDEKEEFNESEIEKMEKEITYSVNELPQEIISCRLEFDQQKLEPDWFAMHDFLAANIDDKKSGWKKVEGSPNRKYATKKRENESVFSIKSEFTMFDKDIYKLFNLLADCKLQMEWDKHFQSVEIAEKLTAQSDIVYLRVKSLFKIISPRDIVMYRFITNNSENIEIFDSLGFFLFYKNFLLGIPRSKNNRVKLLAYLRSVERPNFPPQKGYVRAQVPIILTIMEQSEENESTIKVTVVNNTDMKGKFPKFIFNLFAPDMVGRMKLKLDQAYKKIFEGKK